MFRCWWNGRTGGGRRSLFVVRGRERCTAILDPPPGPLLLFDLAELFGTERVVPVVVFLRRADRFAPRSPAPWRGAPQLSGVFGILACELEAELPFEKLS